MELLDTELNIRNIIKTTFDKSFFVEAGAGAGKTTLIAERIVGQLKSGWTVPEKIVAITFTNEATRGLKNKITDKIKEALNGSLTDDERKNLEQALKSLDQMQISTIHGLCNRLLTEKSFEAGLPMGFSMLEPRDESDRFNTFFVKWVEKNIRFSDWEQLNEGSSGRWESFKLISNLAFRLYLLSTDMDVIKSEPDNDIVTRVDQFIDGYKNELNKAIGSLPFGTWNITDFPKENMIKFGNEIQDLLENGKRLDILEKIKVGSGSEKSYFFKISKKQLEDYYRNEKGMKGAALKETVDEESNKIADTDSDLRDYISKKETELDNLITSLKTFIYSKYVEIAEKAADDYRNEFPAGLVTNDKLLQKTKELLSASSEVKEFFASKFDCIYVDEFQDTDHIQESFIRMLVEKDGVSDTLRDGALFVVGDPKQSIYRFRGAEPEIYFETMKWMKDSSMQNAYVCRLSWNFRSDDSIIDWVNNTFQTKNITGNMPYVSMTKQVPKPAGSKPVPKQIQGVYKFNAPDTIGADKDKDADNLCKLIKELCGKYCIEDEGRLREIKYSDFLVLCANTPYMNVYAKKMKEYDIPFTMIAKVEASNNYYLNAFIRLYAFIADPFDRAAREGAMEMLFVSGAVDESKNDRVLKRIIKETKKMSGYGCFRYLIDNIKLFIFKGRVTDKYEVGDLQRKLYQMTEYVTATGHESKAEILKQLKEYSTQKIEKEIILRENPDAVRFMNLHQAKGLEGGIVIWTNRYESKIFSPGFYRNGTDYYPDIESETGYGLPNVVWYSYSGDSAIYEQAEEEYNEERIRLEYVAATRAKQAIIFMDNCSKGSPLFSSGYELEKLDQVTGAAGIVNPVMTAANPNNSVGATGSPSTSATEIPLETSEEKKEKAESAMAHSVKLFSSKTPSELEDKKAKPKMAKPGDKNDEAENEKADNESDRARGNIVGLSMHRCFELVIERYKLLDDSERALCADSLIPQNLKELCIVQALNEQSEFISRVEYEKYKEFLNDALNAFEAWFINWDEFKNSEELHTELPFSYMISRVAEDKAPVWMHGEADLVIKCYDGSYHIIDYKSDDDTKCYGDAANEDDKKTSEENFVSYLRQKYSPQVSAYKEAVSNIFSVPVGKIEVSLISFSYKKSGDGKMEVRVTEV